MQTEQSKHVSCKRSRLVDVIGKLELITLQTHIVFVFYVHPFKLTRILTDSEGKKVRKQLTTNDVWFL